MCLLHSSSSFNTTLYCEFFWLMQYLECTYFIAVLLIFKDHSLCKGTQQNAIIQFNIICNADPNNMNNDISTYYITTKHVSTLQTNACSYIWVTQQTVKISNITLSQLMAFTFQKRVAGRPSPRACCPGPRDGLKLHSNPEMFQPFPKPLAI